MGNITEVYADGKLIQENTEYLIGPVSALETEFKIEITDEYENSLVLNPESFTIDRTTHEIRIVSEGFEDVIKEFEYEVGN